MQLKKFLKDMPKDLNKYEIARYIYIQLGKYFSYDERYITIDDLKEKQKIFDMDYSKIQINRAVCSVLSKIYVELLKFFGIESEVIYEKSKFCRTYVCEIKN